MSKSCFSLSAACSLWHTSAPLSAVPRCRGRSDGKTNAPLQSQTPCSPFRGLRRSGGAGRGAVRRRRQAASLSRCCGYGYRIVAVDGGRCVIQRRQQIFLDVADILPCSYNTAKHAPAACCVLRYGCNTANHADKKEVT